MKPNVLILQSLVVLLVASCNTQKDPASHNHDAPAMKESVPADTIRKSIPKEEHAQIGSAHITIKYHAPAVRGRSIWGGLVPYDDVWVTGAHSATSFEIDKAFSVEERSIPAGKYALFTIPRKDKWTIIINKNWEQHLTDDYDPKDDVARIDVTPEQLQNVRERLKYAVVSAGGSKGTVEISWEKIKVALPIIIK